MEGQGSKGATTPPDWHPDPTGRHQFRYWDGIAWTEHVADDGRQSTDPIGGPGTASAGGSGVRDAPSQVDELVDAIIGEYRERMGLADRYDAEVKATHGFEWHTPVMDATRERADEIAAAAVADSASARLVAMGPDVIPSILQAVAAYSDELRQWTGGSKSALEGAFATVLAELGADKDSEAVERFKAMLW